MKLRLTLVSAFLLVLISVVQLSSASKTANSSTAAGNRSGFDNSNVKGAVKFDVEVADGVYWVPVNTLGRTRYSNSQITKMVGLNPEKKRAAISSLFEAIQLFQLSKFKGSYDNIRTKENGIDWEHHKPGYDAVRTNEGCCASNSSWLCYLLKNDYEEIGTCGFGQRDGNGHIINYIKHDGWYYFIDMMQYRLDSLPTSGIETGHIKDYLRAYEPIGGNFHRSKSISQYIEYMKNP